MRVGNFSAQVLEGRERESGYVELQHKQQYTIRLGNHCYQRRCDAEVSVDGKVIANLRIESMGTVVLETPPDDPGKGRFTYLELSSEEGRQANLGQVDRGDLGLIRVVFRPERRVEREEKTSGGVLRGVSPKSLGSTTLDWGGDDRPIQSRSCASPMNYAPGGTGLTGHSNQSFVRVAELDHDPSLETIINLRLVADRFAVRPLQSARAISNPVPPAVA
jgi:hypothetical protein